MSRLTTLLFNNNQIKQISSGFASNCPSLKNLILTNNKISNIDFIDKLSNSFNGNSEGIVRLSLVGNIISNFPYYRLYVIYKMPDSLRVLDF